MLLVLVLLSGLLGVVSPAAAGDVNVNVGGITRYPQSGGLVSDVSNRIDKPQTQTPPQTQTGLGSFTPDTTRRTDNPLGGNGPLVPDFRNLGGDTTLPSSNSGTFSLGPNSIGQPGSQFCSSSNVTVGENTQSRLHCSNTVGGTLRQ